MLKNERMLFFISHDSKYDVEWITDDFEMELYDRKNTFFWLVLQHTIQNSTAKAELNKFKTTDFCPNARSAFLAIDDRMTTGLVQSYAVTQTHDELYALRIHNFSKAQFETQKFRYANFRCSNENYPISIYVELVLLDTRIAPDE